MAEKLAHDPQLKERIAEDILVIQEGMGTATCFFCGAEPGDPRRKIRIGIHKVTGKTTTGVRYSTNTMSVPRCNNCHASHNRHWYFMWWGVIAGAILGTFTTPWAAVGGVGLAVLVGGGWLFSRIPQLGCLGIIGLFSAAAACLSLADNESGKLIFLNQLGGSVIGGFATFWIAKKILYKTSPEVRAVNYKPIGVLIREGWQFGDKPAGYT